MLAKLKLTPELKQALLSIAKGGEISEDQADELSDYCTDRLDVIGFDENYEPTDVGKKLEALVDKLYVG